MFLTVMTTSVYRYKLRTYSWKYHTVFSNLLAVLLAPHKGGTLSQVEDVITPPSP